MLCCWIKYIKALSWAAVPPFAALVLGCLIALVLVRLVRFAQRRHRGKNPSTNNKIIGIFHPYCNAGGGGERVLWSIVQFLERNYPKLDVVIYTGDTDAAPDDILAKMNNNFCISLKKEPRFVFLSKRSWVEASRYPAFTLLGQSLGSLILGLEALFKCVPDYYLDTMGYSFTFPLFKYLGGCTVACYVHYPTISTDMIETVNSAASTFNNKQFISRSKTLTAVKLIYYRIFAFMYGVVGRTSDCILVNSSWTRNHINSLWQVPDRTHLAYPPCNTKDFEELPLEKTAASKYTIVSVAQFRPEKNHALQIVSLDILLKKLRSEEKAKTKLILVGSCRNKEDEKRVTKLRSLCTTLGLDDNVEFSLNFSFKNLLEVIRNSGIGLHTMYNEHFGISVVENMAGGLIMLANDSGGPQMDIINKGVTGYLASTAENYADVLFNILQMSDSEQMELRTKARKDMVRFSDEAFHITLSKILSKVIE